MEGDNKEKLGMSLALADMFVYGLSAPFSNYFVKIVDPLLFAAMITLIGVVPFLIVLFRRAKLRLLFQPLVLKEFVLIGVFTAFGSMLFYEGTRYTSAINTGLLEQSEPIYALVLGWLFLGEKFHKREIAAMLIMILGALCVTYRGSTTPINIGDIMVFCCPLFFQFGHLFAKRIMGRVKDSNLIAAARLFYSGIILLIFSLIVRPQAFSLLLEMNCWLILIGCGLFFRSLDMMLWYRALEILPLAKLSALLPIGAGIGFLAAVFVFGEVAQPQQWLGVILLLLGLTWLSLPKQEA